MNGDNRVDSLPREAEGASDSSENRGLCRTQDGLIWEYIDRAESDFLYHEVFCARLYLREGVTLLDGDIVVDVGANIGLFSLMCLSECPSTRVVAIEPVPQICDVLHRNLHFAKSRVSILRSAAGSLSTEPGAQARLTYFPSRPGESTRHRAEAEDMNRTLRTCATDASNLAKYEFDPSYRVNAPQDSVEVEAPHCTLLDVIRQLSLPCIDLLKVDVEGDELDVLLGLGSDGLDVVRQVVVEVHDIGDRLRAITDVLRGGGFRSVITKQIVTEVCEEDGFVLFVPPELQLFMVYAIR